MTVRIISGGALEQLRLLPAAIAHCCVTSPPYYGLRDYGCAGQIGLEPSPDDYISALIAVFREVRRVLRPDGTLWLNIGDSYAGGGGFCVGAPTTATSKSGKYGVLGALKSGGIKPASNVKSKDLLGIPWMLAFALRADGWWLRQDIIWSKPNPMPESVTDRCTKAHEYLFLLSRSGRYWFDAAAIAEKSLRFGDIPGGSVKIGTNPYPFDGKQNLDRAALLPVPETRNKRSVWTVASEPFAEAHFATFPPALIEPCILAGCPRGGLVIDPFGGAGTTGLVADRLGRDAILIDINPSYAAMARKRLIDDAGMFAEVAE